MGMLWKQATPAAGFWGFLSGIISSIFMFCWVHWFPDGVAPDAAHPEVLKYFVPTMLNPKHVEHIATSPLAKDMAVNMFSGFWSLLIVLGVTIMVSLFTKPKPDSELKDLVYGLAPLPDEGPCPWYKKPAVWAGVVAVALVAVNVIFW
jgi:SSS family solute:Na+ symporter